MIDFIYDDGGRAAAGYKGIAGDCVVRAISIAARLPYQKVYNDLKGLAAHERITKRQHRRSTVRDGVRRTTIARYLETLGWAWEPCMKIGSGCHVHLLASELPAGRLIVSLSRHLVAVVNGVVRDTYLDDRDGKRCVYGYWHRIA